MRTRDAPQSKRTLDIAEAVDTGGIEGNVSARACTETIDECRAHRAIPSPMVRTRPVSWTSAPAVEPEMRLSRMEATSDAAVTHLARVSDGAHSHSRPSSDSPGLAVAYERARAGRCEGEGGSSSVASLALDDAAARARGTRTGVQRQPWRRG